MATKLIQESTLTNIANAIRAKTGKVDTMTPPEMPSEIGSISGGSSDKVLLQTIKLDEDVSLITFDVSNYVGTYDTLLFELNLSVDSQEWLYYGMNGNYRMTYATTKGTTFTTPGNMSIFYTIIGKMTNGKIGNSVTRQQIGSTDYSAMQTFGFSLYEPDLHKFLTGSTITLYGLEAQLC